MSHMGLLYLPSTNHGSITQAFFSGVRRSDLWLRFLVDEIKVQALTWAIYIVGIRSPGHSRMRWIVFGQSFEGNDCVASEQSPCSVKQREDSKSAKLPVRRQEKVESRSHREICSPRFEKKGKFSARPAKYLPLTEIWTDT